MYQRAIELIDLIENSQIRLREIMPVFNHRDRRAGTRLLNGTATEEDLDIVEKAVRSYNSFKEEGITEVQMRRNTSVKARR